MRYRAETTALATDNAARRSIARVWNGCREDIESWPDLSLIEPAVKSLTMVPWEAFNQGLRSEIESYLTTLTKMRRGAKGKRIRPCKPSTVDTRRREIQSFCRAAVQHGTPIGSLASLTELLNPNLVEIVLNAFWKENGEEPNIYTIDLAWKLLSIARETKCLREADLEHLDNIRAALEEYRRKGLTPKNLEVIRSVLTDGVWDRVLELPAALMGEARRDRYQSPTKAAVNAQLAVAIAILSKAPIRIGNLIATQLEENLIRLGGLEDPYWLVFPHYDVKNRVQLEFKLDPELSKLIDEYIHDFRPLLMRGSNSRYLFPGATRTTKAARTLSLQITDRILKVTGLRITAHQFRHAAAAIVLKHRPGQYELVRRLLGHRNVETTVNFYIGLENIQAAEIFGDIIRGRMTCSQEAAE
jgi:integrase